MSVESEISRDLATMRASRNHFRALYERALGRASVLEIELRHIVENHNEDCECRTCVVLNGSEAT